MISLYTFFWLVGHEISRSWRLWLSGSNGQHLVNISHMVGVQYLHNSLKILFISLQVEPGPWPKAVLLFLLTASPLYLHSLTSIISSCRNLPLELREGHGGRKKTISCNQKWGTQKSFCAQAPHRVLLYHRVLELLIDKTQSFWINSENPGSLWPASTCALIS